MAIKQMGVRMDTSNPEYRWRKAQGAKKLTRVPYTIN